MPANCREAWSKGPSSLARRWDACTWSRRPESRLRWGFFVGLLCNELVVIRSSIHHWKISRVGPNLDIHSFIHAFNFTALFRNKNVSLEAFRYFFSVLFLPFPWFCLSWNLPCFSLNVVLAMSDSEVSQYASYDCWSSAGQQRLD